MWVKGEFYDSVRDACVAARGRLDDLPSPFQRLDWYAAAAAANDRARPLIARARSGSAETWLFLARDTPRRLHALGNCRAGPVLIGDPTLGSTLLRAIARRLGLLGARRVTLEPIEPGDAELVTASFRAAAWRVTQRTLPDALAIDVEGRGFDEYWETRSAELHDAVEAGSRRLLVEIADRLTPTLQAEAALLGLDDHLAIVADQASRDGRLRLGIARVGETPVAAQLWLVQTDVALTLWRAEDTEAKSLHPTAQLTAAMLRYAMNVDGVTRVELGQAADFAGWAEQHQARYRLQLTR